MIFSKLKEIKAFESFQPMLLQQLCYYGYYENLDKGVTCKIKMNYFVEFVKINGNNILFYLFNIVFRHGDVGTNWYVCLSGSVDVVLPTDNSKVCV